MIERELETETDRQTDRQMDGRTDGRTDRGSWQTDALPIKMSERAHIHTCAARNFGFTFICYIRGVRMSDVRLRSGDAV